MLNLSTASSWFLLWPVLCPDFWFWKNNCQTFLLGLCSTFSLLFGLNSSWSPERGSVQPRSGLVVPRHNPPLTGDGRGDNTSVYIRLGFEGILRRLLIFCLYFFSSFHFLQSRTTAPCWTRSEIFLTTCPRPSAPLLPSCSLRSLNVFTFQVQ